MRLPWLHYPIPRTDQTGALIAAAGVPLTFQRTLMTRLILIPFDAQEQLDVFIGRERRQQAKRLKYQAPNF